MSNEKRTSPIADHVEKYGFHVTKVMGDEEVPSFAYTVGLGETARHPEIVIFGLNDDLDAMHRLLNTLGARVREGERFEHGARAEGLLTGFACAFARFPRSAFEEHLGQALAHYGKRKLEAVQCIWPDTRGAFPWEPTVIPGVLARQPVFLRPEAGPRDPTWPFAEPASRRVLTTRQVVEDTEPVRFVGRFPDGDWQFVCETTDEVDDAVIATLGFVYDRDPSLKRAAKLEPGEAIVRGELGGRFRPTSLPEDE